MTLSCIKLTMKPASTNSYYGQGERWRGKMNRGKGPNYEHWIKKDRNGGRGKCSCAHNKARNGEGYPRDQERRPYRDFGNRVLVLLRCAFTQSAVSSVSGLRTREEHYRLTVSQRRLARQSLDSARTAFCVNLFLVWTRGVAEKELSPVTQSYLHIRVWLVSCAVLSLPGVKKESVLGEEQSDRQGRGCARSVSDHDHKTKAEQRSVKWLGWVNPETTENLGDSRVLVKSSWTPFLYVWEVVSTTSEA